MALQLDFSNAEAQRLRITQEQQRKIQELYKQASAEIARQAGKAPRVPSDALRKSYLNTLQGQIDERLRDIEAQLNGTVRSSMTAVAAATVGDAKQFLQQNGLSIKGAYSHVPADIVNAVASGQLYSGNWTLSRALWLNTKETQQDVQNIVAQGIIQNKSAFEIAKDLERYVDPTAKKDWDWSKVYPGTRRVVDYNAQRLARTMVSHAYQQAFVRTTQKNPFVKKYKWEASNSERTCELCEERNGQLFDKDDLPLDHPNGMCTFTAVMDDMDTIGERLGDWAAGKDDPELDAWAKDIYGKGWEANKPLVQKNPDGLSKEALKVVGYVTQPKSVDAAATSVNPNFNPKKYTVGTHTNCAYCSTAVDMMLIGYTVAANERIPGEPIWSWATDWNGNVITGKGYWTDCFQGIQYQEVGATRVTQCEQKIADLMNSYGANSRGIVYVKWKTGGGHYFNVVNEDGSVRFIDGQNSKLDCSSYFAHVKPSSVAVFRTDNCPITDYASKVVHRND